VIARLSGVVVEKRGDAAVLEVQGVGYLVHLSLQSMGKLPPEGGRAQLRCYTHVREDALQLFGFANRRELAFFRQLTAVSGVGPKVALSILSAYPVEDLELAALQDDHKRFESIPGIGRKLAQRLIVELKDRIAVPAVGTAVPSSGDGAIGDLVAARSALINLGLTYAEADVALKGAPAETPVEELVRYALVRAREP
jgi:Holliday junction DNA helicase RuvA